ncbi:MULTISPECIES: glycosyltransferase [Bacillaceae]|uniref:Glycosyltransferase n=1 Tax=Evansella alkalicola TaxID=745819 RepID=A0ABS6JXX1_9BACI|nr:MULTISPECIES: glycosyltransferase [Bacillaceae]MBU9723082.1 glycosyltransferase [Bacillus alkalicola]
MNNEKKKVLFITPNLGGGGAEKVIVNILKFVDRKKIEPEYLALNLVGPFVELLPEDIKVSDLQTEKVSKSIIKLIKSINKSNPDIIMSTLSNLNLAILFIKPFLRRKTKIIVRQSNTLNKIFEQYPYWKKCIYKLSYSYLYRKADKIIVQSEGMKEDLLIMFPSLKDKVIRIPNPIDLNEISVKLESVRKTSTEYNDGCKTIKIVAVGRLTYQKGFDTLLKAFKQLKKNKPNIQLSIVGEGPLKGELKELTSKLDIMEDVDFKGFVNNPYEVIYNSDIFVLPSRYEGFPNILLEALACETKIVATDCKSGPREILGANKYGTLVKVDDVNELSNALLININGHARTAPGYQRALNYDVKNIVKQYEEALLKT